MKGHRWLPRIVRWLASVLAVILVIADQVVAVCWHWDRLSLHLVIGGILVVVAIKKPAGGLVATIAWSSLSWWVVAGLYADPGSRVLGVHVGASVKGLRQTFGRPEFDVDRFVEAAREYRDMVSPVWFDRALPAIMWRIDGFRVWVTHVGDRVTAVDYRNYSN
jgi:hypothetical protein